MAPHPKAIASAIKEGGKKGVDIAGIKDMGGMSFFTVVMEQPKGDLELLKYCLEGANKEVDESEEERKGGAGQIAKALVTTNDDVVTVLIHLPKVLADQLDINEWAKIFSNYAGASTHVLEEGLIHVDIPKNADAGVFPLKVKDELTFNSYAFLQTKGLVPPLEAEDENDNGDFGLDW